MTGPGDGLAEPPPAGSEPPPADAELAPTSAEPPPADAELAPASAEPPPAGSEPAPTNAEPPVTEAIREPRPWIERIGLAGIAIVMAGLFGTIGVASWHGGEVFLAAMGAIGCLMTLWVGALTVIRG